MTSPNDLPRTVGELRASGHRERGVKDEIRENLLAALAEGRDVWPGILGFEDTVLPQLERALIAGHDVVLLGERGQGKTRLLRALSGLLDEWTPVIAGSELGEHPYTPITPESIRRAAESGDDLPIEWRHRSERYIEKLATPDTSVADLVGDIDPIKVAEGRSLGDPETIAYGLIPRAHRGIVAINELPDLAERIQVSMLNVMEERDIQVRGYTLRLPLDVVVVASANPEDYTNRGRIITPLKDRFGAEIRTHYPLELDAEVGVISQEAHLAAEVPEYLLQILARFARCCASRARSTSARVSRRGSRSRPPRRSPRRRVTARPFSASRIRWPAWSTSAPSSTCCAASWSSSPVRRAASRRCSSTCCAGRPPTPRQRLLGGIDVGPLVVAIEGGSPVTTGERVSARDVLAAVPEVPAIAKVQERLGAKSDGQRAAAVELALEALYLAKRIDKVSGEGETVYG